MRSFESLNDFVVETDLNHTLDLVRVVRLGSTTGTRLTVFVEIENSIDHGLFVLFITGVFIIYDCIQSDNMGRLFSLYRTHFTSSSV